MPVRIQRKRTKGWRMPPNTVYVGRGSMWGNPFTGEDALDKYMDWIHKKLLHVTQGAVWKSELQSLRGKNLACWCPLDKPCHADILLKLANGGSK